MRYNITPETKVYARVESVDRYEMSRTITFYMIEGGERVKVSQPGLAEVTRVRKAPTA